MFLKEEVVAINLRLLVCLGERGRFSLGSDVKSFWSSRTFYNLV